MITYYVVQPFSLGRKGIVIADLPIQASSQDHALRMAERLAMSKQAVIAFSRTGDPKIGEWEAAIVLAVYGYIPEEVEEEFAVA